MLFISGPESIENQRKSFDIWKPIYKSCSCFSVCCPWRSGDLSKSSIHRTSTWESTTSPQIPKCDGFTRIIFSKNFYFIHKIKRKMFIFLLTLIQIFFFVNLIPTLSQINWKVFLQKLAKCINVPYTKHR